MPEKPEYNLDFKEWQKTKSPEALSKIVSNYIPLLKSEISKYKGNINTNTLLSFGKKYIADAIKTYNPAKSRLGTHIATNLMRLHRLNYEASSPVRMSEELQMAFNVFKNARDQLKDKLGREPTIDDLSDELGWTQSKVGRMQNMMHSEAIGSNLLIDPSNQEMDDPRLDYIYHDLDNDDKIIFQHRTGYKGSPIKGVTELANQLNTSASSISQRAEKIAKMIQSYFKMK